MKYQHGFIGIVVLVIVSLVALGGGYVLYRNKQASSDVVVVQTPVSVDTTESATTKGQKLVVMPGVSTSVSTILDCTERIDCLVAAAKACTPTTATMSYTNIQVPIMEGLQLSGMSTFKIQKNPSTCALLTTSLSTNVTMTSAARAQLRTQGMTDTQIDQQLQAMNEGYKLTANKSATCTGTNAALAEFIQEQLTGGGNLKIKASVGIDYATSVITTSSGATITCTQ